MSESEIADRIFSAAQAYAASKGVALGEGADHEFQLKARQAAQSISAVPPDIQDVRVDEAIRNFLHVIDHMVVGANSIEGYRAERGNVIGERTLGFALRRVCPLWPFC
jgi:hypothetical protein